MRDKANKSKSRNLGGARAGAGRKALYGGKPLQSTTISLRPQDRALLASVAGESGSWSVAARQMFDFYAKAKRIKMTVKKTVKRPATAPGKTSTAKATPAVKSKAGLKTSKPIKVGAVGKSGHERAREAAKIRLARPARKPKAVTSIADALPASASLI